MPSDLAKSLIEAGVSSTYGISTSSSKSLGIKGQLGGLDVRETVSGLLRAKTYMSQVAAAGGLVLFVGTKRAARGAIQKEANRCSMPFVSQMWLRGTLTNFASFSGKIAHGRHFGGPKYLGGASKLSHGRHKLGFRGLSGLTQLPKCLFVVDPIVERVAVYEARRVGINVVALTSDTNVLDYVSLPILGNDSNARSIQTILKHIADALIEGRQAIGASTGKLRKQRASPPASVEAVDAETSWTDAKNERRCELILKNIDHTLTPEEQEELSQLTTEVDAYLLTLTKPRNDALDEIERRLSAKARKHGSR